MPTKTTLSRAFWTIVFSTLGLSASNGQDKPSKHYDQEMQRHASRDLTRFENGVNNLYRQPHYFKVPHQNVRAYYDLVGLPADSISPFRVNDEHLHHSPESIKREWLRLGREPDWEIWRLSFLREEISWTAPGWLGFGRGFDEKWAWVIAPEQRKPGMGLDWDWSLLGTARLVTRELATNSGFLPGSLTHWRVYRHGGRHVVPKLKLSDLKELAPWFYAHIPSYVLERADWFDFWETESVAVYIYNEATFRGRAKDSPRMIEFVGWYSFEGESKDKQFDTHFSPDDFRRIHIRGNRKHNDLNLSRPCRECDVLILDAPDSEYRIRFIVPAPNAKTDGEASAGVDLDP